MAKQTVDGNFLVHLRGIPFLMWAVTRMVSRKGYEIKLSGFVIGPFIIGTIKKVRKLNKEDARKVEKDVKSST